MLRWSLTILKIHTPENCRDRGQREDGEREGEREKSDLTSYVLKNRALEFLPSNSPIHCVGNLSTLTCLVAKIGMILINLSLS